MKYYRFKVSVFKTDLAKTFVEQITVAPDERSIAYKTNPALVENLQIVAVRDNWEVITQEEYETVRTSVVGGFA